MQDWQVACKIVSRRGYLLAGVIFAAMENALAKRIQKGKMMLYIGLVGLVILHFLGIFETVMADGWQDINRLYFWQAAVVVVGGLGTLRGGNPVRYIYTFVLLLLLIAGIFGMWVADKSLLWYALGLLNAVFAAFVIYLLMFNDATADFLAAQRAKYFGFAAGASAPTAPQPKSQKKKGKNKSEDAWDAHDDLYE